MYIGICMGFDRTKILVSFSSCIIVTTHHNFKLCPVYQIMFQDLAAKHRQGSLLKVKTFINAQCYKFKAQKKSFKTKALTGNKQLSREKNIHPFTSLKQKKSDLNLANIKRLHCQIIFIGLHLFVDQVKVKFLAYFVRETTLNPMVFTQIHKFRGVININTTSDVLCIGIANVHDQLPIPYYNLWHGCVGK